jgi:hypothetical protein
MLTKDNRTKKLEQKGLKMKFFFFFLFSFFISLSAHAQCAMCRAALESEEGGVQAEAVNDGIVYLMAIPYILVGILGFAIYRIKYGKKKEI